MDDDLDILSCAGFIQHIYQTCRLHHKGSGFLAAPVCSSFVAVNLQLNFGKVCFCLGLHPFMYPLMFRNSYSQGKDSYFQGN